MLLLGKKDDKIRLYFENFKDLGIIDFNLEELKYEEKHDWANYPKGVIKIFKDSGYNFNGKNQSES